MDTKNSAIKQQQRFETSEEDNSVDIAPAAQFSADTPFTEAEHVTTESLEQSLATFDELTLNRSPTKAASHKGRLGKACLLGIVLIALVETGQSLYAAYTQSPWLFGLYVGVMGLVICWSVKVTIIEWRKLKRFKHVQDTQATGTRLLNSVQMGEADPFIQPLLAQWPHQIQQPYLQQISDEHNDAEKLLLFEQCVLVDRDLAAKIIVRRFAKESALLLAASPLAVLDMAIILWRNQKMINQLAKCYAIDLGNWSRIKLIRGVMTNIIYAGTSEIVTDLGTQLLSVEMSAKLSARLGQGLGGGLLTARLGYQAMALCRPLAFTQENKPKLTAIHKELLLDLKQLTTAAMSKAMKSQSKVPRP